MRKSYFIGLVIVMFTVLVFGDLSRGVPAMASEARLSVASATANLEQSPNVAANTIDDNETTRWSGQSVGTNYAHVTFDLGSTETVSLVKINWYNALSQQTTYDIAVSTNGSSYTVVYSGTSLAQTGFQTVTFGIPQSARYVRIIGKYNSLPSPNQGWISILETEIYGPDGGGSPTPTPSPTPPSVYEAENGVYGGGAGQQNASNASNGKVVGALNNIGAYSQINNVDGGAGGSAYLVVRFSNGYGSARTLSLYVNGVKQQQLSFANTGGWNTFSETSSIPVTLSAGTGNTIKIQRDSADSPAADIDKYTVTLAGSPSPTPTPTAPPSTTPFSQSVINAAMAEPLLWYERNLEWDWHSARSGAALMLLTAAVTYDVNVQATNGTYAKDRIVEHIRNILIGGKEPACSGGMDTQTINQAISALAIVKTIPAFWNELTSTEKDKITLIMQSCLIASHWGHDDGNNFNSGLNQLGNWNKNWNPNHIEGGVGMGLAAAHYLGGAAAANNFLVNFNYDNFVASLTSAGLTGIKANFNATGKTALEAATKNTFEFNGHSLSDPFSWLEHRASIMYNKIVSPTGGGGFGTIACCSGGLPNVGQLGMAQEFDSIDADGPRSSLEYAALGWQNSLFNLFALKHFGQWGSGPDRNAVEALYRIGSTDLIYKAEHGYNGYSKGAYTGIKYENDIHEVMGYYYVKELWLNALDPNIVTPTPTPTATPAPTPTPTPSPTPGGATVYEAESGTYGGGAGQQNAANASNGKVVGALNNTGAYSQINNVDGGSGGSANLVIRFSNGYGSARTLSLYVNGVKQQQLSFANTGGWNSFADTSSIPIALNAGAGNTIKIQRDSTDSPAADIDKYTVTLSGAPTPTPTPTSTPPGGVVKPDASNTGIPSGVTLTAYAGPASITTNGTVIDLKDYSTGDLVVYANNVTLKRSKFKTITVFGDNCTIEDVDTTKINLSGTQNTTITRANIHGNNGGDTMHITSDTGQVQNVLIQSSYIHSQIPGGGDHSDGIQIRGSIGLTIRNNHINMGSFLPGHNSPIFVQDANGGNSDLLIEGNWLNGGGYMLMIDAGTNLQVNYNRIGNTYEYGVLYPGQSSNFTQTGNVWDSTGAPLTL